MVPGMEVAGIDVQTANKHIKKLSRRCRLQRLQVRQIAQWPEQLRSNRPARMRGSCSSWERGSNSQCGEAFVGTLWTPWSSTSPPGYGPNSALTYAHRKTQRGAVTRRVPQTGAVQGLIGAS